VAVGAIKIRLCDQSGSARPLVAGRIHFFGPQGRPEGKSERRVL